MMAKNKTDVTKNSRYIEVSVVSLDSGKDTIKVEQKSKMRHPKYEKLTKTTKKYLVHVKDEEKSNLQIGQTVKIRSVAPISARKNHVLITE